MFHWLVYLNKKSLFLPFGLAITGALAATAEDGGDLLAPKRSTPPNMETAPAGFLGLTGSTGLTGSSGFTGSSGSPSASGFDVTTGLTGFTGKKMLIQYVCLLNNLGKNITVYDDWATRTF